MHMMFLNFAILVLGATVLGYLFGCAVGYAVGHGISMVFRTSETALLQTARRPETAASTAWSVVAGGRAAARLTPSREKCRLWGRA